MDENADPTTASTEAPDTSAPDWQEALHTLLRQSGELYAYLSHYISAQVDVLKLSGQQVLLWTVIAGLGAVVTVSALVTSVILLLVGLSTGVGQAVGGVLWLGQVIVGLGLLVSCMIVLFIGWSLIRYRSRTRKVQEYAERQRQQRFQYGHSAADRSDRSTV